VFFAITRPGEKRKNRRTCLGGAEADVHEKMGEREWDDLGPKKEKKDGDSQEGGESNLIIKKSQQNNFEEKRGECGLHQERREDPAALKRKERGTEMAHNS